MEVQVPESEQATELERRVRESNTRQVHVIFLDYNGITRARSVPVQHLSAFLARGVNFSSPTVDFNSRDLFPPSAAFDLASPDFWALPDPRSYRESACRPDVGQMYADLVTAQGEPWEGCPRTALRRVVERAADIGLCFNVGFEPEGYVFREEGTTPRFVGAPQFATLQGLDVEPEFTSDLLDCLLKAGIEVEQWSEEYGPGQIEVNLRYAAPVAACDALITFRDIFRTVARRHALLGTFMPKPFGDQAGAGLHVHLSACTADAPERNLFDDPSDRDLGLTALGRNALAGLLEHGEALTALGATTVNSYKRFLPGSWAPTHIMYAYASRAAFVRIPERETARRLELRIGDPAGNPYMFCAGILAAMLDGIERELDPGAQVAGDVGAMSEAAAVAAGARPVPRTLERALDHLERDRVIRGALGDLICDEFVKIKRSEWEAFCLHVGEWDRSWYLARY